MVFAHDTALALQAAAAIVNSAEPPDTLTTVAELDAFFRGYEYTGRHDGDRAELEAVRAIRPQLRTLMLSPRLEAIDLVNAMLAEHRAVPRLVRHGVHDWHLHAVDDDAPLTTRLMVETAMAMVDVIRADEMSRLGTCADDDCEVDRARPLAQPLQALLLHRVRQPQRGRGLPRPPGRRAG